MSKYSKIVLILGLLATQSHIVWAESSLEDLRLNSILSAKSPGEMEKAHREMRDLERLRAACRFQLVSQGIPAACLDVLDLEAKSGAIHPKARESTRKWLLDICIVRVEETTRIADLQEIIDSPDAKSPCQLEAKKRQKELKYKAAEVDPADLFLRRAADID